MVSGWKPIKQPTNEATRKKITPRLTEIKELMSEEANFLRPLVGLVVQEALEAELSEALGAQKGNEPRDAWATAAATTCAA
jgi:transposase-like protein